MVANLGRESLVPRDEEVRPPHDLVILHTLARSDVAKDADVLPEFWHDRRVDERDVTEHAKVCVQAMHYI